MEFSGNYFKTFLNVCLDHMKSFNKIGVPVFEKKTDNKQTDIHLLLLGWGYVLPGIHDVLYLF